jgi:hypothetical protein
MIQQIAVKNEEPQNLASTADYMRLVTQARAD